MKSKKLNALLLSLILAITLCTSCTIVPVTTSPANSLTTSNPSPGWITLTPVTVSTTKTVSASSIITTTVKTTTVPISTTKTKITATTTRTSIEPAKSTITTTHSTTVTSSATTIASTTPPVTVGQAQVTRIIDGDTIEVLISGKTFTVRYIGMDTPETGETLFQAATDKNAEMVSGKIVRLEKDVSEVDKMDNPRLLRYVYIGDIFVNAELVRLGYARATPYPPDVKYESLFSTLENEAKAAQLGMWAPALLSLQIVSVTSPVKAGDSANLVAKTKPNAECTITVYLKSDTSGAAGLTKKNADSDGKASWTWKVGSSTTHGEYKIVVTAGLNGETVSQTTYFTIQ